MKRLILLCVVGMAGMAFGQDAVSTNSVALTTNSVALTTNGVVLPEIDVSLPTNQTVITSDRMEYDYSRSLAVFTGNVLVRDKDMRMWADEMTVIMAPEEEIESVTAIGRVVIIQPGRKARCRKAMFLVDQNEVILTGDAVIKQERDRVEGRVIHIWTDREQMVSEPGHLVVFTKESEDGGRKSEDGGRKTEP